MPESKTKQRASARKSTIERVEGGKFAAGVSANPAGRPKGSRNKLGEAFITDLYESWKDHGAATIDKVRVEKPDVYVKVVASLMPQHHVVETPEKELTDEQLEAALDAIARLQSLAGNAPSGGEAPSRRARPKAKAK